MGFYEGKRKKYLEGIKTQLLMSMVVHQAVRVGKGASKCSDGWKWLCERGKTQLMGEIT